MASACLFRAKRLAARQRVICGRPSLTSGQTSDTLMLLVCVAEQLSHRPCVDFLPFVLPLSVFSTFFLFFSELFLTCCLKKKTNVKKKKQFEVNPTACRDNLEKYPFSL